MISKLTIDLKKKIMRKKRQRFFFIGFSIKHTKGNTIIICFNDLQVPDFHTLNQKNCHAKDGYVCACFFFSKKFKKRKFKL